MPISSFGRSLLSSLAQRRGKSRRYAALAAAVAAACGVGLTGSSASAAPSGTPAFTITPNPNADATNGQWSLGYSFTPTKSISVTSLGFYDAGANGLTESHAVGLYTSKGTLLGSVTVTNSSPLENFFRYVSLSKGVTLQAGQTYIVVAETGTEDYQFTPTSFTLAPGITFDAAAYISSTTLAFPTSFEAGTVGYFGGSFLFGGVGGISGPLLQNSDPIDIPTTADFTVIGQVQTGNPLQNNEVHTLTFTAGSSLTIFNTLYVSSGPVVLVANSNLDLNGSLMTQELVLLPGSLLNGNGNIFGNLVNGGTVSPGHSPGQINVTGDYTQTPTGTLTIQLAGRKKGQFDVLSVGGKASLGGRLEVDPLDGFTLRRGDKFTFLTAADGVNGKFSMVKDGFASDTILNPSVVYHHNSVSLVVPTFESFAERMNLTPNQKAVAAALDSTNYDSRVGKLISYMDGQNLVNLPGAFDRISPEELTSIFTTSIAYAQQQSLNLQRRTDDIRSGSSGFNAANLAINGINPSYSGSLDISTGVAGPNGYDGKEIKETKEVAPGEDRWGAFLSGTGEWVNVTGTDNARGYDLASGGFTFGADYKVTPNFAIGLAAGYTGTTADLNDHGRVWVNGGKLGLYSTVFSGGWYADMAAFGGYNGYDTRRSALEGDARGSTHGGEVDSLFGTGYDFKKGSLTFGPTATFDYTYTGMDGFTEHNSLAPLNIHGGDADSLRTAFGIKASYDWKVGGIIIKPELRAAWQHEFGDTTYSLNSSFADGVGSAFNADGPKLGRDSALIGAGFAIQCNDRCSVYCYYDGELGRKNYESTAVTGGFRLAF